MLVGVSTGGRIVCRHVVLSRSRSRSAGRAHRAGLITVIHEPKPGKIVSISEPADGQGRQDRLLEGHEPGEGHDLGPLRLAVKLARDVGVPPLGNLPDAR